MSARAAPPGGARGPRRPAGPRSGAGARSPGGPRRPRHVTAPGQEAPDTLAVEHIVQAAVAPSGPETASEPRGAGAFARWGRGRAAPAPDAPGELAGLRRLLDQLDAWLRDPTLALALRALGRRIAAGVRELTAAAVAALKRLPRLRLRLPRRLLLGLLALLLPLVLVALLTSGADERAAPGAPAAFPAGGAAVGMPALQAAPDDPPPANVALVIDDSYGPVALRRELRTLGTWIAANHAAGTHVSVIDAATGRASAPLSAAQLARGAVAGSPRSTTAAIRSALARERGRRLLVSVGAPAPRSAASTLSIAIRRGAGAPASVPLRRGSRTQVAIDDRRPDALAASVARALIAISGQSERR